MWLVQGTIDFKDIYKVTDAIALIAGSSVWAPADSAAMHAWMEQHLEHLRDDHVRPERCSNNNHGSFFDIQYITVLRCGLIHFVLCSENEKHVHNCHALLARSLSDSWMLMGWQAARRTRVANQETEHRERACQFRSGDPVSFVNAIAALDTFRKA